MTSQSSAMTSHQTMMERADEYAEYLLRLAKYQPAKLIEPGAIVTKGKSITSKLLQIYLEESTKISEPKRLNRATHLLDKLVRKEKLNTLVVNLYPGNDGYSLMLRGRGGTDTETMRLPYEESEFLDYVDNEEIPPILLDLMEKAPSNLFYNGCVIVELRDYRRAMDGRFESRHVLLRPGAQSLFSDIQGLTHDGRRWTQDDIFTLESQLIMATQEPLCLDPSPAVFLIENRTQHERKRLSVRPLKRLVSRHNQIALNRRNKFKDVKAPEHLRLHDFIKFRKPKLMGQPQPNLRLSHACVDLWRSRQPDLAPPKDFVDVEKYATVFEKPKYTSDTSPVTVEEYILEAERDGDKKCYTRLKIQQRLSDDSYVGELYVDRDHRDGQFQGSSCRFTLGNQFHSKKYIEQFTEIFTEEGRRAVKITHLVPDHPPQVSFTHGASALHQQAAQAEQASGPQPGVQGRKPELSLTIQNQPNQGPMVTPPSASMQNPNAGPPVFSNINLHLAKGRSLPGLQKLAPSPQAFAAQAPFQNPQQVPRPPTPQESAQRRLSVSEQGQPVHGQLVQGLPPGINLHNLANLQNLQGVGLVQSLQVSVSGVPVSGGQIAVPLSVINTSQSSLLQQTNTNILQTPTGIIINSLPGASTSNQSQQQQQQILLNAANVQKTSVPVSVGQGQIHKTNLVPMTSVQGMQKNLVPVSVQHQGNPGIQQQLMQLASQEERQGQFLQAYGASQQNPQQGQPSQQQLQQLQQQHLRGLAKMKGLPKKEHN